MARETSRRALLVGTAVLMFPRLAQAGVRHEPLFRIERSKNANVVQYDAAVVTGTNKLRSKEPVVAYWILYAEDGRREGLGLLDRQAYGFRVAPESGGSCLLYLNATADRSIRVLSWRGRWVAQIAIRGRSAILQRIYVATDESGVIPSVRWVDLFGVDMVTGERVTERLSP